jgi:uncharacterized protein
VMIEPPSTVLGLSNFEQYIYRTQDEGVRSGPGDLDLTIYGLRKFLRLAAKGNPSILLLLFAPVIYTSDAGDLLLSQWRLFHSKAAGRAYLGYMTQQFESMKASKGVRGHGGKRPELIEKYGFDSKFAGHVVRLGYQGYEYMTTGRLSLPMEKGPREHIIDIRTGKVPYLSLLDQIVDLVRLLEETVNKSLLPERADENKVNELASGLYRGVWDGTISLATRIVNGRPYDATIRG